MRRPVAQRELWATLVPTAGALVALAAAASVRGLSDLDLLGGTWAAFGGPSWALGLAVAGAAGAFHRPVNRPTLGLGVAALAPAVLLFGVPAAAGLAGVSLLAAEIAWRLVRNLGAVTLPDRRRLLRSLEGAGQAVWAALAAGALWAALARLRPASGLPARLAVAAVAYLLVWGALLAGEQKLRRPEQALRARLALPLLADLGGWLAGAGVALTGARAGWGTAAYVLGGFMVAAVEAGRNGLLLARARRRAGDLERLRRASTRMITPEQEMVGVAERILAECEVVKFQWYLFETLTPGSEFKSWWAGPDRELHEGVPDPDPYPPALPGFHKRSNWQIQERHLRVEGRVLARLRLWCDPRLVEAPAVQMLDRLLPQMTASVRRCLLDREAREDPLTGLSMRRVLERSLHEAHAQAIDEGGSLAVVLCDLDHFKRINDSWGHSAGDAALIAVSTLLKQARRAGDVCCRYGGEEFVMLLPRTDGQAALAIAERLRAQVAALPFQVEGTPVPLTMSAGAACFPDLYIKTAAELLLFADEALYEAKRSGRNRCLLDLGQGRYLDVAGSVHAVEEAPPAGAAPPRIFV